MFIGLMSPTHLFLTLPIILLTLQDNSCTLLLLAAFGSQIPDLDTTKSNISKIPPLNLIAGWIEARYPHRSLTHSLLFTFGLFGVCGIPYILGIHHNWKYWVVIPLAHLVSSIADQMTKEGTAWFWPLPHRVVFWRNPHRRITTGTPPEYPWLVGGVLLTVLLWNVNATGSIAISATQILGNESSIAAIVNSKGSNHHIWVNVKGNRTSDRAPINDKFFLIANPSNGKFILQNQQGLFSTGEQIIPSRMTAEAGQEARVTEQAIAFNDELLINKLWPLYKANQNAAIYLTGNLEVSDPEMIQTIPEPDKLATINVSGTSLNLNYADLVKLGKMGDGQWVTGNIVARIISPKPAWTQ